MKDIEFEKPLLTIEQNVEANLKRNYILFIECIKGIEFGKPLLSTCIEQNVRNKKELLEYKLRLIYENYESNRV